MLREIALGVRMAFRQWALLLAIAGMIGLISGVLSLVLGDVVTEAYALREATELRQRHAVRFSPYYLLPAVSNTSGELLEMLALGVSSGAAYTSVIYNVQVEDESFAHGVRTVLLLGDAPAELFPSLQLCEPAPCGMAGASVAHPPTSLNIADVVVEVVHRLPRSAALFDPRAAGMDLDDALLLRLPGESINSLDEFEREEAVVGIVWLDPPQDRIDEYVSMAKEQGLLLVPEDISSSQSRGFIDMIRVSLAYLLSASAFGILALTCLFGAVDSVVTRYRNAFVVSRMYGARPLHVVFRLVGLIGPACLALPLLPTLACLLPGPPFSWGAYCTIGILVLVFAAVLVHTSWKVVHDDEWLGGG